MQTDLAFIGLNRDQLNAINPRLIPLIAHDRAGFGGATATAGLLTFACVWWGTPSRSLWQALLVGGLAGWTTAIGVHPAIGYVDAFHLVPAVTGRALRRGPRLQPKVDAGPRGSRLTMGTHAGDFHPDHFPTIHELGEDLLRVTPLRRSKTLLLPFLAMACYAFFAVLRLWPLAVLSVMALASSPMARRRMTWSIARSICDLDE